MPKRCFSLDPTGEYLVELEWRQSLTFSGDAMVPAIKNLRVKLNGKLLHVFPDEADLIEGKYFTLLDDRRFSVRLREGELETRLQGILVPGSDKNIDNNIREELKFINYQELVILFLTYTLNNISLTIESLKGPVVFLFSGLLLLFFNWLARKRRSKDLHSLCISMMFLQNFYLLFLTSNGFIIFLILILSIIPIWLLTSREGFIAIEAVRATEAAYAALGSLDEIGQQDEAPKTAP